LAGTRRRVAASYAEPCWRRWAPCSAASLVYDFGLNVETAGDYPVWHKSEADVFPGQYD
jgi:hypothetical protein